MVLSTSLHISWYYFCTWSYRLSCKTSKCSLTHPLWFDNLHLYGAYVCFPTEGRLFCLAKPYFSEQERIMFIGLFIKICNIIFCYPKYSWNIWLYLTLTETEFNGTKRFSEPGTVWEKHIGTWLYILLICRYPWTYSMIIIRWWYSSL